MTYLYKWQSPECGQAGFSKSSCDAYLDHEKIRLQYQRTIENPCQNETLRLATVEDEDE